MPKALITGIAGQTGSHLADYILEDHGAEWEVHGITRYRSDLTNIKDILSLIELHDCDLRDAHNVDKIIAKVRPEKIFHLAATSFVRSSWDQAAEVINNNVTSQINIMEAMRRYCPDSTIQVACFPPGTRVECNNSYENIEDVQVGDMVVSPNGSLNLVTARSEVPHSGKLFCVHVSGCRKIWATGSHPFLAIKRSDIKYDSGHLKPIDGWPDPKWINAEDLESGDLVAYVVGQHKQESDTLCISDLIGDSVIVRDGMVGPKARSGDSVFVDGNAYKIANIIKLDHDFGYLCGAYLAEGSQSGRGAAMRLHLHEDEIDDGIGHKCIDYLRGLGVTPRVYDDVDSRGKTVFVGSTIIAKLMDALFGHGSKLKSIDRSVFGWPREALVGLIKGYLDGDGWLNSRNNRLRTICASSVSMDLVDQLALMANNLGMNPNRSGPYNASENSFGNSEFWRIEFSEKYAPELFDNATTNAQQHQVQVGLNYFRKIIGVAQKNYSGLVYNFTINNTNAYVVEGCCVHNCSSEQYGMVKPEETPIKETNPIRPLSPYAVSKIAQEKLSYQYNASYGLRAIVTRTFNHCGPRRGDAFVESSFCKQVAMIEAGKKEPIIHHGNLDAVRDYTDARDIVEAYWLATEHCPPGVPFNVCSGEATSINKLLDDILSLASVTVRKQQDPARMRPSDVLLLLGDSTKFRELTEWKPRIPFKQTMNDLLEAWRKRV